MGLPKPPKLPAGDSHLSAAKGSNNISRYASTTYRIHRNVHFVTSDVISPLQKG